MKSFAQARRFTLERIDVGRRDPASGPCISEKLPKEGRDMTMTTSSARIVACLVSLASVALAESGSPSVFERSGEPKPAGRIDRLVFARFEGEGVTPARVCSDAVFCRRVHLDMLGTLPTAERARTFIADKDPRKRSKLVEEVLARDEYADYNALRWADRLRIKAEFPINLWPNACQAYHRWVHTALRDNMPYDRFARALLTSSGSNFRVPPVNFYRAVQSKTPESLAKAVSLAFLGERMTDWPEARREGFAKLFSRIGHKRTAEWKEEIVYFDTTSEPVSSAILPDGTSVTIAPDRDPREVFADWLISPDNPRFARCAVNRIWQELLGRGIVHPCDDMRSGNPPSHPKLLDALAGELVSHDYDLKHVYRLILNSTTYQLSSIPRDDDRDASARWFGHYAVRRLEAEVLIDAICRITGTTEEYHSKVPEPFTWVPETTRSICLPDGSITSSFLDMFGKPPRDTGLSDERDNDPTAAQTLHLLNSSHILNKISRGPDIRRMRRKAVREPVKTTDELYLTILSRHPTREELQLLKAHADNYKGPRWGVLEDMAWALLNSSEFLYRH
jgi:hypothetical protein